MVKSMVFSNACDNRFVPKSIPKQHSKIHNKTGRRLLNKYLKDCSTKCKLIEHLNRYSNPPNLNAINRAKIY